MVKFRTAINNRQARTDNGAVTLATSGDPNLDLFFLIGAARGKNITAQFRTSYINDPLLTTSIALWARDIRGGAGERELFRQYLHWLEANDKDMAHAIIASGKISEVGRWDDYLVFLDPGYASKENGDLVHMVCTQIAKGFSDPNTIGLVAKWMPRQGNIARKLGNFFGLSPRNWRKLLVRSTNVVEQLMCAKEWEKINFNQVPSVASSRYQKAFGRHVPEQYSSWKTALVKNDGTAKVNATTLYPYDIIKSDRHGDVAVSQAQWDALPNYLGDHGNILPILDVSGSMGAPVSGGTVTMMDVCISLGLYIALNQKGDFNRVVMNFSGTSEIVHLKSKGLKALYNEARGMAWNMNTNLEAAFTNLLKFGKDNGISNEEMPKTILIMSDMQFDSCVSRNRTNMESIKEMYNKSNYTIPNVVFWCLNGKPGNSPVTHNTEGVALISGFSPSIMKSILGGKDFNPRSIMLETVNVPRYQLEQVVNFTQKVEPTLVIDTKKGPVRGPDGRFVKKN